MVAQYQLTCCGKVFTDVSLLAKKECPHCKTKNPMIEELDKEDHIIMVGKGFSGDDIFESRPWGSFNVIADRPNLKIKELIVNPNSKISLQLHRLREEFWVVLRGKGMLTLGLDEIPVEEGQPIHIRQYEMHSIHNYTDEELVIIEVQKGICQEDDIIRIEDDYGRVKKENFSEKPIKDDIGGRSTCCGRNKRKDNKKKQQASKTKK